MLFTFVLILNLVGCSDDDDYVSLTEDFTYNDNYYAGAGDVLDSSSPRMDNIYTLEIQVSSPTVKGFEADGCFVLRGNVTYTGSNQYALVSVTNLSVPAPASYYWVRKRFQERIWLRSGAGLYKISVHKTDQVINNLNYEGALSWWRPWGYDSVEYGRLGTYNFFVTNTRNESGAYYYPSGPIQSDDPQIKQIADGLVAGKTDETNKVQAIHDYVVKRLEYDHDSIDAGQRKKQDALSSLNNKMAVCEGYALLFSALSRSVGIRSKYITGYVGGGTSAGHAWSGIEVDGNWSLVDTTWDDPGPNSDDPNNITWTFFMQSDDFFAANEHTWQSDNIERSLDTKEVVYELKGYPRGSY